jgi:hypothetical protein
VSDETDEIFDAYQRGTITETERDEQILTIAARDRQTIIAAVDADQI